MSQDDRTAPPTERRRRQAREQGIGPRSQDLCVGCRLVGIAAALQFSGANLLLGLAQLLTDSLQRPLNNGLSTESAVSNLSDAAAMVAVNLAQFVAWILVSGVVARLAQVGFRIDFSEVTPDFERINPATRLQQVLTIDNGIRALFQLLKYLLLIGIGGWFIWSRLGQFSVLAETDLADGCQFWGLVLLSLTWQLAFIQLAIGLVDFGWQYWKFEQSLKMTQEEVRQEQ